MAGKKGSVDSCDLGQCQNCEHWKKHDVQYAEANGLARHAGVCALSRKTIGKRHIQPDEKGCIVDSSGALLIQTGESYGCPSCEPLPADARSPRLSETAADCERYWKGVATTPQLKDEFRNESALAQSTWLAGAVLEKYPVGSLLEIGSGSGRTLHMLHQRQPDRRYAGCDISEKAVAFARRKTSGIEYETASCYSLPYDDRSFDAVLMVSLLTHVPPEDLPEAVAEIKRVAAQLIVNVEWFTKGTYKRAFSRAPAWSRDYTDLYAPDFACLEVHPLARAYSDEDSPLFCWAFERVEGEPC